MWHVQIKYLWYVTYVPLKTLYRSTLYVVLITLRIKSSDYPIQFLRYKLVLKLSKCHLISQNRMYYFRLEAKLMQHNGGNITGLQLINIPPIWRTSKWKFHLNCFIQQNVLNHLKWSLGQFSSHFIILWQLCFYPRRPGYPNTS